MKSIEIDEELYIELQKVYMMVKLSEAIKKVVVESDIEINKELIEASNHILLIEVVLESEGSMYFNQEAKDLESLLNNDYYIKVKLFNNERFNIYIEYCRDTDIMLVCRFDSLVVDKELEEFSDSIHNMFLEDIFDFRDNETELLEYYQRISKIAIIETLRDVILNFGTFVMPY
jgi:hypothetical protein